MKKSELEKENAELKAQVAALSGVIVQLYADKGTYVQPETVPISNPPYQPTPFYWNTGPTCIKNDPRGYVSVEYLQGREDIYGNVTAQRTI